MLTSGKILCHVHQTPTSGRVLAAMCHTRKSHAEMQVFHRSPVLRRREGFFSEHGEQRMARPEDLSRAVWQEILRVPRHPQQGGNDQRDSSRTGRDSAQAQGRRNPVAGRHGSQRIIWDLPSAVEVPRSSLFRSWARSAPSEPRRSDGQRTDEGDQVGNRIGSRAGGPTQNPLRSTSACTVPSPGSTIAGSDRVDEDVHRAREVRRSMRLKSLRQSLFPYSHHPECPPIAAEFALLRACVEEAKAERNDLRSRLDNLSSEKDAPERRKQPKTLARASFDLVPLNRNGPVCSSSGQPRL